METKTLKQGDRIYKTNISKDIMRIYKVVKVSKHIAECECGTKFKTEINENGHCSRLVTETKWDMYLYTLENDTLKQKLMIQNRANSIRNTNFELLSLKQLDRILDIIKESN